MTVRRCCVDRCGDGLSYLVLGMGAFWLMMTNCSAWPALASDARPLPNPPTRTGFSAPSFRHRGAPLALLTPKQTDRGSCDPWLAVLPQRVQGQRETPRHLSSIVRR
jgi:hypothetical protein